MNEFSPNLKPSDLHTHNDRARKLGVPRSNIIDLRGAANTKPVSVDFESVTPIAPATPEPITTPAAPAFVPEPVRVFEEIIQPERTKLTSLKITQASPHQTTHPAKHRHTSTRRSRLWLRPLVAFACMTGLIVAPFSAIGFYQRVVSVRDVVTDASREALGNLRSGGSAVGESDFVTAASHFTTASTNFREAHDQLTTLNADLASLLQVIPQVDNQFSSADNLMVAGDAIAGAGANVAQAFTILAQVDLPTNLTNDSTTPPTDTPTSTTSVTDILVLAHSALRPAVPRLQQAAIALAAVDVAVVPSQYQAAVQSAKDTVPVVADSLQQLQALTEVMLTILGQDGGKRYLVLFQNNREQRATGGFIGSFAVVDINQGKVSGLSIPGGGPYDLLGSLKTHVISPEPLHLINPAWQMQDANWWPDFPTSAEKIQWFYRKSGGSSVDGVITLTPDVIEQMLVYTGPIDMPEYNVTVDQTNFYDITQQQAERKFDDTRESKKFIADLTPRLLNKLMAGGLTNLLPVLQIFYTALNEKDILLHFNDPFIQNEVEQLGWTGSVRSTSKDYLQVVDTNIGGGKTDAVIDEVIQHQADIQSDGSIIDTVIITRTHRGASGDPFADVNNWDYLRVYVPAGSTLISATGYTQPDSKLILEPSADYELDEDLRTISGDALIDEATKTRISEEFNKTVFGNWVETRPGETSLVTLQYRLPFTLQLSGLLSSADYYGLLVQKQPGSFDPLIITSVNVPDQVQVVWSYPAASNGVLHTSLTQDQYSGLVLTHD